MSISQKQLLKYARDVREKRVREDIFIEGVRLGEEAAQAVSIQHVLHSPKLLETERGSALLQQLRQSVLSISEISDSVLDKLADTKTSQGIILLASRPDTSLTCLEKKLTTDPIMVILHQVNNPSNAGAMIRVAEAAGASGIITTEGSVDLFSPKALRGSMGSCFRMPVWAGASFEESLHWCQEKKIQTVSTDLQANDSHYDIDWRGAQAILIGSEANGLTEIEAQATNRRIRIPMQSPVESLNAAVALGVVLYEAARQRRT